MIYPIHMREPPDFLESASTGERKTKSVSIDMHPPPLARYPNAVPLTLNRAALNERQHRQARRSFQIPDIMTMYSVQHPSLRTNHSTEDPASSRQTHKTSQGPAIVLVERLTTSAASTGLVLVPGLNRRVFGRC